MYPGQEQLFVNLLNWNIFTLTAFLCTQIFSFFLYFLKRYQMSFYMKVHKPDFINVGGAFGKGPSLVISYSTKCSPTAWQVISCSVEVRLCASIMTGPAAL